MIHIHVLGFDQALASAITGVADLFSLAGVTWNRIQQQDVEQRFSVTLASAGQENIRCINGLELAAHESFASLIDLIELDQTLSGENDQKKAQHIVIVPTIAGKISEVLINNPELLQVLRDANRAGWMIAGNCTGHFLLAEAGILNHNSTTTHWGLADEFSARYPTVSLETDKLLTRDGHIFCAGGGLAWFDLGLHLIERCVDFETAAQTAKAFVIDFRRESQLSYSLLRLSKSHQDELIKNIQNEIEDHCAEILPLESLAEKYNISLRTLIRRFNNAVGMPPNRYLQAVRVEKARKMLEESDFQVEVVMTKVGYEDASSFRRLFKKKTGLTPTEYRARFGRR